MQAFQRIRVDSNPFPHGSHLFPCRPLCCFISQLNHPESTCSSAALSFSNSARQFWNRSELPWRGGWCHWHKKHWIYKYDRNRAIYKELFFPFLFFFPFSFCTGLEEEGQAAVPHYMFLSASLRNEFSCQKMLQVPEATKYC